MSAPTLRDVVAALEKRYPPGTAESWDAVGLVAGDPAEPVRRVLLAVDPVAAVVDEALEWGADLLLTHHPLFLRGVHSVAATTYKGALVHRLVRGGCALYAAHTNADAARGGVAEALAEAVGLVDTVPLVPVPSPALDKVVVFVPEEQAEALVDALADAGAGALGDYERCAWTTTGEGTFTPQEGAAPAIGAVGRREHVRETRVEMVAPRSARARVLAALRAAHPYEEPAFDVLELAAEPGSTGLGRVGTLPEPATLADFAARVARAVPATVQGVRWAGDPQMTVRRVAVLGGSGDSLFDAVRAADVDAYVTADLRHHPASEQQERAAFEAAGGAPRPALVDLAHSASEWPWLARAAADLVADLQAQGTTVETRVSTLSTDPWTGRVDQTASTQPEGTP
ncbi:Nif3-like dinuclear metal center hexameric protein [Cellulomonas sp. JZ18]|uniref:Nif3-like dinuclear metal center hexameric protein n=1 Tax=Cellulomonas sp. JZ18 TaxID=2654191 RepID=UPI0012D4B655|nr:Nif3-like dinuclear metal center hexameric protein [Cellulomonas sp. JZ18]QGQ19074.1 Nif3-like dinuclear metal center hexameric protein [Cellulomonas sp. JZ18]